MPSLNEFRFPVRDADIFFSDDPQYTTEDKMADADFNQRAVEDYLSDTLPTVYIQQASLGSGTIDPTQLATGTPGAGKAPVGNPPAWTDIATQNELDAVLAQDIQRGVASVTTMNGTNTVWSATFGTAFSASPRVTATVESGQNVGYAAMIIAVDTNSMVGRVFVPSSTTATCRVHWHAIKQ